MRRYFVQLGLPFVVLLTMSALLPPAVSAQFASEVENTTLTTSSNATQKFTLAKGGSNSLECTTISPTGAKLAATSQASISFEPSYSNCEEFLGDAVSASANGCKYVLHLEEEATSGPIDVQCPEGKSIEFKVGSICAYKIGSQSGLSSFAYTTTGSGTTREIVVEPNIEGLTSTRTTNDLFCPGAGSTGTLTGNFTLTGENGSGHVGVWVS